MEPYRFFLYCVVLLSETCLISTIQLKIDHHQVRRKKAKVKVVAPVCGKITPPKEYIKTQKVTNGPNLITQSEAPVPELIVVDKLQTDISLILD